MAWLPSIYELAPDNSLPEIARLWDAQNLLVAPVPILSNTWIPAPALGSPTPPSSGIVGGPIDSG